MNIDEAREAISAEYKIIDDLHCYTPKHSKTLIKASTAYCEMQWRPISEYDEKSPFWVLGGHVQEGWIRIVHKFGASGWYQTNSSNKGYAQIATNAPTHFMPLPQPPQEKSDGFTR